MTTKPHGPAYRVGDRVRLRFGPQIIIGTIVEDRGFIGSGGRRLYGVKAEFDQANTIYTEVGEEELTAAN